MLNITIYYVDYAISLFNSLGRFKEKLPFFQHIMQLISYYYYYYSTTIKIVLPLPHHRPNIVIINFLINALMYVIISSG